jgi:hypothetical protein
MGLGRGRARGNGASRVSLGWGEGRAPLAHLASDADLHEYRLTRSWPTSSCSTSSEVDIGSGQEEEHEGRERGAVELHRCIDAVRLHPHRGGGGREEEPRGAHSGRAGPAAPGPPPPGRRN